MVKYPSFPVFVDLSDRRAVVIGGGKVAARRVGTLVDFCPSVTVVAPKLHPDIEALAEAGRAAVRLRRYESGDLDGASLVLACTDDAALNAEIAEQCRRQGIPVNVSSDRGLCDFLFPGIARRDNLVIGVTASGEDHRLARRATEAAQELVEGMEGLWFGVNDKWGGEGTGSRE